MRCGKELAIKLVDYFIECGRLDLIPSRERLVADVAAQNHPHLHTTWVESIILLAEANEHAT